MDLFFKYFGAYTVLQFWYVLVVVVDLLGLGIV